VTPPWDLIGLKAIIRAGLGIENSSNTFVLTRYLHTGSYWFRKKAQGELIGNFLDGGSTERWVEARSGRLSSCSAHVHHSVSDRSRPK